MTLKIVVLDDEKIQRIAMRDELVDAGHSVLAFDDPHAALASLENFVPDVLITDLRMPGLDGLDVLRRAREIDSTLEVILVTAYSTVETAVEAMRLGARDYITKPFRPEELLVRLERIERSRRIEDENQSLREEVARGSTQAKILGESRAVRELVRKLEIAATSDSIVLLEGETGTGKDLAAEVIHQNSSRRGKPFFKVSCAAYSQEVIVSELFGHERGAFTGADRRKIGRFELANGGTVYLDEVDDIPLPVQVKLLRVLEDRVIERVGGTTPIPVDVRMIAATKRDLEQMVAEGRFREDLFYRLNVYPIEVPPLRERREDVPELFRHFLSKYFPGDPPPIAASTDEALRTFHWPGNIRQVRNEAERVALECRCTELTPDCLSPQMAKTVGIGAAARAAAEDEGIGDVRDLKGAVRRLEIEMIRSALRAHGGNRSLAAEQLGLPVTTLKSKIQKYGLRD